MIANKAVGAPVINPQPREVGFPTELTNKLLASDVKMTSKNAEPLACITEDQQHKPCPVLKLTAKLEMVSTCISVDLLNENCEVASRDWGVRVHTTV